MCTFRTLWYLYYSGNRADPEKFEILAGASDIQSQGGTKVGVAEIKIYPSYKIFYLGDDIALFVLARKLTFSSSIQPICLPSTEDTYGPGSICYATGWGKTTANGKCNLNQFHSAPCGLGLDPISRPC